MKFRSKDQIAADYPWMTEKAKENKEAFGGYSSLKITDDGEQVYSWECKETYIAPTNTILDRDGYQKDMTRKPHKWNDGINKRGERK